MNKGEADMNDKKLQDILKAADNKTLLDLSRSAPLSDEEKDRIFSESMKKFREKQQSSNSPIIMSRGTEKNKPVPETEVSQIKTGVSKTIISAAAALLLVAGLTSVFFMHNNKIDTTPDTASSPTASVSSSSQDDSHEAEKSESDPNTAVSLPNEIIPDVSAPVTDISSQNESVTVQTTTKVTTAAPSSSEVPDTQTTVSVSGSSSPQSDSSYADDSPEAYGFETETLSYSVLNGIDQFNEDDHILKGEYADLYDGYDSSFEPTQDENEIVYYRIPDEYRQYYDNFEINVWQGPFTERFITDYAFDTIQSCYVEHEGSLYFRADSYFPNVFTFSWIDDDIHMTGPDSFYVNIVMRTRYSDNDVYYKLFYVYENVPTTTIKIWKIDHLS